jgi:cytochrome c oxidase cbb3-type subunit 3
MKPHFALCLLAATTLSGCERESREFGQQPSAAAASDAIQMTTLEAGTPSPKPEMPFPQDGQAYDLSQGKRLYTWYNCNGCHAMGGGDSGPPLMDDAWIYGSEPENIFATIVEGRPNGMPSFRGRIPDFQVWQLVAYVRSMSGLVPRDAAPSRQDGMQAKEPELMKDEERPKQSFVPPASQQAQ